jgi:hypothetical protein
MATKQKPKKKPAKKSEDLPTIVWQSDIPVPVIEEPEDWYTKW